VGQAQLLQEQLRQAKEFLHGTLADVTPEQAHWLPPGTANPVGATYGHVILGEDTFVNVVLRGGETLASREWASRLGMDPAPPSLFPPQPWQEWGRSVKVDLAAMREYAHAVFENTEKYIGSLSAADLEGKMDLSPLGLGEPAMTWVISNAVLAHRLSHWGEIACLKGMQGAKGLPF
jgi:DinB superfamily